MNAKNNRVNHDFQIAYFLAGSCHTPDGAYALLCDLRDDRDLALKSIEAVGMRSEAKRIRAERLIASNDEADRLDGQADIAEMQAYSEMTTKNIAAAQAELEFIDKCIEKVQPLRKFAHLPDPEAHESAQVDEWKLELIHRAENHMLTTGTIPPEELKTMRMHPAFEKEIAPALASIGSLSETKDGRAHLLGIMHKKEFDLPLLLGNEVTTHINPQPEQ